MSERSHPRLAFYQHFDTFLPTEPNAASVVKLTSPDDLCFQEHLIENEVSVLRQVKHPNIIMLIEEVDTSSELYLVMELVKVALMLKEVQGVQNVFVSEMLQ